MNERNPFVRYVGDKPSEAAGEPAQPRRHASPEAAANRVMQIARSIEPVMGRIYVEKVNAAFLREGGSPAEYGAGIRHLRAEGLIDMHDSGAYFSITARGA